MSLSRWVVSKGIWYALCVAAVLGVGSFFNILPQSLKDFLKWLSDNTVTLVVALCFVVGCWTVIKVSGHRKHGES
jgi:TRAP-type C4-dicarboxylate transport system permease small subunit